jgi:hypothetical protein
MKVIIKGIMNENRTNDFIDRVVNFLIDGTTYTVKPEYSYLRHTEGYVVDVYMPVYQTSYEFNLIDTTDWLEKSNIVYQLDSEETEYMYNYFGITNVDTIKNILVKYYEVVFKEVERLLMDIDNRPSNPINENINRTQKFINKVSEILTPPYFKNLELYIVPKELWNDIFSIIYNKEVSTGYNKIFDNNNNEIYYEESDGNWLKQEYDNNNNKIYNEDSDGNWLKYEYDNNNNEIYREHSDGWWLKQEYDNNNNKIYNEDSNGNWLKQEYDNNNNRIYYEKSDGYWEKYEYDNNNNRIYYEKSTGFWIKREYDNNNNRIYYENSDGEIIDIRTNNINENINRTQKFINKVSEILEVPYFKNLELYVVPEELWNDIFSIIFNKEVSTGYNNIFDSYNNEIYYEHPDGNWSKSEFDNNNNEIYYEDSDGNWLKYEYDNNNNEIYREHSDGWWSKYEYDNNNNRIYYEDSSGFWHKSEYDNNNNEIYYEDSNGKIIDKRRNNTINENINRTQKFINKISEILTPPYFKSLELYIVPEELWNEIFSIIYNKEVSAISNNIYDNNNNRIYREHSDGWWSKSEYDNNNNRIYYEESDGYWEKREFDSNNNVIYREHPDGYWYKQEYDNNNNKIYNEDSNGFWSKYEYDNNNNEIYYEDSNGKIIDRRN